jgi:hypothetical protein
MGKIPGLEYKSPNSTKLSDQVQRPAAAKALSTESTPKQVMPTDKVILLTDEPAPKAERLRKARAALESWRL